MKTKKNLLAVTVIIICSLLVLWLTTTIHGSQKTYEIEPQITIPEYKTDTARVIDAYERLMDRYLDLTESNLIRAGTDIQYIIKRLDTIDARLTRIENALGIEQPKPPAKVKAQP